MKPELAPPLRWGHTDPNRVFRNGMKGEKVTPQEYRENCKGQCARMGEGTTSKKKKRSVAADITENTKIRKPKSTY
jgi:hypothetical protein